MTDPIGPRMERVPRLRWVALNRMKISPLAQRELNSARVDHLVAEFDPDQFGTPTVSERDGWFFVIDGQHRVEAARRALGPDQHIQCWVYSDLAEADEAELDLFPPACNSTISVAIGAVSTQPILNQ